MWSQGPQRSREGEQHTQRDHCQLCRRPCRWDYAFDSDSVPGAARDSVAAFPGSRLPPSPSFRLKLAPEPRRTFKDKESKNIKIFMDTSRKRYQAQFQLLTHPFQCCGRSNRRSRFTFQRAVHQLFWVMTASI